MLVIIYIIYIYIYISIYMLVIITLHESLTKTWSLTSTLLLTYQVDLHGKHRTQPKNMD